MNTVSKTTFTIFDLKFENSLVIDCGELICDGNAARKVAKDKLSNPYSWAVVRSELGLQSKATLKSVTIYNTNTVFFEVEINGKVQTIQCQGFISTMML